MSKERQHWCLAEFVCPFLLFLYESCLSLFSQSVASLSLHPSSRIALFTLGSPVCYEIPDLLILALNLIPAPRHFFWATCCSNQTHGRLWWKAWMGLDFHHHMFGMFWNSLQSLNNSCIWRITLGSGGPCQFFLVPSTPHDSIIALSCLGQHPTASHCSCYHIVNFLKLIWFPPKAFQENWVKDVSLPYPPGQLPYLLYPIC